MSTQPLILVTVGTDHHRFDRLIDWVDEYSETRAGKAEIVVQYGYSRVPHAPDVDALELVGFDELQALMRRADVLVTPGPNTVMEAREYGLRGIYIPRDPARGEHVDEHQVVFARHSVAEDLFVVADDQNALFALLDAAIEDPGRYRFDPAELPAPAAIAQIGSAVDALVWGQEIPRS